MKHIHAAALEGLAHLGRPPSPAIDGTSREAITEMGGHLGGLLGGGQFFLASIYCVEVVQQRLDCLNARVLSSAVEELTDERDRHARVLGQRPKVSGADFSKPTLEESSDGFD